MNEEIDQFNQGLSIIPADDKIFTTQYWIGEVIDKIEHYKAEHHRL